MGVPYAEVIGDPISHSKSPLIHNFWLEKLGLEGDYRPVRVSVDDLGAYFAARRSDPDWRGCNVTMPLKERVLDHVDELDERADEAAASNCVLGFEEGLIATNTDSWALTMKAPGILRFRKRPVVVIGSGGAARAALATAAGLGVEFVTIVTRNFIAAAEIAKANGLSAITLPIDDQTSLPNARLLINATPLGMHGYDDFRFELLESLRSYPGDASVFDMVYSPRETSLLMAARKFGLEAVSGIEMLVEQARRSFELLFRARPNVADDAELMALLGR